MSTTPALKRRLGNVTVIVWRNIRDKGPWYSVEFHSSYLKDDTWRESKGFTLSDLPAQLVLNQMATTWILNQQEADRKGRKQADNVTAK
jgi:hypothetical protein